MSWALLGVGVAAALGTVPAFRLVRRWWILLPAFFVSLAVCELAGWWLALLATTLAGLAVAGAVTGAPGIVGLLLGVEAAAVLVRQMVLARRAPAIVGAAVATLDGGAPWVGRRPLAAVIQVLRFDDRRVRRVADLRYAPGAGRRHLLDVYTPAERVEGAPVLLQIHGGAWVAGGKRTQGRHLMNRLARAGWVCVALNYRLSPRVHHPEHLIDCKRALAWVREHIAEYGGDPTRVSVTGGSAGGHLAALMALTINDPAYQPGFEHVDTSVIACAPLYGAYSLAELFALPGRARRVGAWMGRMVAGVDVTERSAYDAASPLHAVRTPPPPFFVAHGTNDTLVPVDQARRFVVVLREATPDAVAYAELPGAPHAFDVFGSVRGQAVVAGVERFLTWALAAAAGERRGPESAASGPTTTARTAPS